MKMQLSSAKRSFVTRNVDLSQAVRLLETTPRAGDLVLARVERIRQHTRLEDPQGRRVWLYPGDRLILAAAPRYSTAQYKASTPMLGACQLVAAGGIAALVQDRSALVKPATELFLEGVLADASGTPLNLQRFKTLPPPDSKSVNKPPCVLVIGSDMDAGKTTTACAAVRGLSNAGFRVLGAKLTGTGAGPDYWRMWDAGAVDVVDFVDAGLASTSGVPCEDLIRIVGQIEQRAIETEADMIILEVADGVLQPETAALLGSPEFTGRLDGALVAADSAVAASFVAQRLVLEQLPVLAISGAVTRSPVACQEVSAYTALPVYTPDQLLTADVVKSLFLPILRVADVALGAIE